MASINQLSADVKSLLRTGIAITSVTQCIEELLLNAIDAGASCVAVRIDMTCNKFQVVDNGTGMTEEQLVLVGQRYSTSKCHTIGDLDNLCYFGYRGEAIASIKDVTSVLEIVSRTKMSTQTYCKMFQKGKPLSVVESAFHRPSAGTTVTVHDLFYNMPVRKNCINVSLEIENIKKRIEAIALMRPGVSITLRNDVSGNVILQTQKTNSILNTFSSLYGVGRSKFMSKVQGEKLLFTVSGYIGKEGYCKKDCQFIYINGRLVLKTKIHKLVNYLLKKSLILKKRNTIDSTYSQQDNSPSITSSPTKFAEKHGMYVINIKCPFTEYDITFEPAKTLVEFKNWDFVTSFVEETVQEFLKRANLQLGLLNDENSPFSKPLQQELEENGLDVKVNEFCRDDSNESETIEETSDPIDVTENIKSDQEQVDDQIVTHSKQYGQGISTHNNKNGLTSKSVKRPTRNLINKNENYEQDKVIKNFNRDELPDDGENCDSYKDMFHTPLNLNTTRKVPKSPSVVKASAYSSQSEEDISNMSTNSDNDGMTDESEEPLPTTLPKRNLEAIRARESESSSLSQEDMETEHGSINKLITLKPSNISNYSSLRSLRESSRQDILSRKGKGKTPVNRVREKLDALNKVKDLTDSNSRYSDSSKIITDSLSRIRSAARSTNCCVEGKISETRGMERKTTEEGETSKLCGIKYDAKKNYQMSSKDEEVEKQECSFTKLRKLNVPLGDTPTESDNSRPKSNTVKLAKKTHTQDELTAEKFAHGPLDVQANIVNKETIVTGSLCNPKNTTYHASELDNSVVVRRPAKRPGESVATKLSKMIRRRKLSTLTDEQVQGQGQLNTLTDQGQSHLNTLISQQVLGQEQEVLVSEPSTSVENITRIGWRNSVQKNETEFEHCDEDLRVDNQSLRNSYQTSQNSELLRKCEVPKTRKLDFTLFSFEKQPLEMSNFTAVGEKNKDGSVLDTKMCDTACNSGLSTNKHDTTGNYDRDAINHRDFLTTELLIQTGQSLFNYDQNVSAQSSYSTSTDRKLDENTSGVCTEESAELSDFDRCFRKKQKIFENESESQSDRCDIMNVGDSNPFDKLQSDIINEYDRSCQSKSGVFNWDVPLLHDTVESFPTTPEQDYAIDFYGTPVNEKNNVNTDQKDQDDIRSTLELDLFCHERIEDMPIDVSESQGFMTRCFASQSASQGFSVYPFNSDRYRSSAVVPEEDEKYHAFKNMSCVSPVGSEGFSPVLDAEDTEHHKGDHDSADSHYIRTDTGVSLLLEAGLSGVSEARMSLHSPVRVSELFDMDDTGSCMTQDIHINDSRQESKPLALTSEPELENRHGEQDQIEVKIEGEKSLHMDSEELNNVDEHEDEGLTKGESNKSSTQNVTQDDSLQNKTDLADVSSLSVRKSTDDFNSVSESNQEKDKAKTQVKDAEAGKDNSSEKEFESSSCAEVTGKTIKLDSASNHSKDSCDHVPDDGKLDLMSPSEEDMMMMVADAAEATVMCNDDTQSQVTVNSCKESTGTQVCTEYDHQNFKSFDVCNDVSGYVGIDDDDDDELGSIKWKDKESNEAEISKTDSARKSVDDLFENWNNPVFRKPEQDVACAEIIQSNKCDTNVSRILYPLKFTKGMLQHAKVLGQVDNKFIACLLPSKEQNQSGDHTDPGLIVMIDQHAAHERVRLEQLTAAAHCKDDNGVEKIVRSAVVPPEPIQLSEDEVRIMTSFQQEFERIGITFTLDSNKKDTVLIHTIPACIVMRDMDELKRYKDSTITFEIVVTLIKEHTELLRGTGGCLGVLPRILHKALCNQSCRGAIKFGDKLSLSECEELLQSLIQCNLPFQCAHGRPSVVPVLQLDKMQIKPESKKPKIWKITGKLRQKMDKNAE